MSKLYYTQNQIHLRKTQLNILPAILFGIIHSESVSAPDIAKVLKEEFSLVQYDSVVKRIRGFFNNTLFEPYLFYKDFISYILNNYKRNIRIKEFILVLIICSLTKIIQSLCSL